MRDSNNGYRYLDLAYMPEGGKGVVEIQGCFVRKQGTHSKHLFAGSATSKGGDFLSETQLNGTFTAASQPKT